MKRKPHPEDVFVFGPNDWHYREEWESWMGDDYTVLMTETPEWVYFMENEA